MPIDVPKDVRRPVLDAARTRDEKNMDKALAGIVDLQHLEGIKLLTSGEWKNVLHGTAPILLQRIEVRMAALRGSTPEGASSTATPAAVSPAPVAKAPSPAAPSAPVAPERRPEPLRTQQPAPVKTKAATPVTPPAPVAPPAPERRPEPPRAQPPAPVAQTKAATPVTPPAPTVQRGGGRGAMEPLPVSEPDEFRGWVDPDALQ